MTDALTAVLFPEEDSSDLSDGEIEGAEPVETSEALVVCLQGIRCECGEDIRIHRHELRRRAPNHYTRVLFVCKNGHHGSKTYRVDSLLGGR